jgi:hypothetical protein
MAIRETAGSLRAYFIVVALLAGVPNLLALFAQPIGLNTLFCLASVGLAAAYMYLGVRLKTLLVTSPGQVLAVILAGGVLIVIGLVVSLAYGSIGGAVMAALELLVVWYLYVNARRLSSEAAAASPA